MFRKNNSHRNNRRAFLQQNRLGDRITVVSGQSIMACSAGVNTIPIGAISNNLFGDRIQSLSALYADYRVTKLSFKLLPQEGASIALAADMEYPESAGPTTLAEICQYQHFDILTKTTTVPTVIRMDRDACLRNTANKWFKTISTAPYNEQFQGAVYTYTSSASTLAVAFICYYEIQFCNAITSGVGLTLAVDNLHYQSSTQESENSVSLANAPVVVERVNPPPTSRFAFLRK